MDYREAARQFVPQTREDAAVRQIFLDVIRQWGDVSLTRDCALFHFTSSAMVFDESFSHVLMAYHNIYQSWAWTGGHCDGETRPLQTAMREAREETGIRMLHPLSPLPVSLDILPVAAHEKRGRYVPPHLHLSFCYSFCAPQDQPLRERPEENSSVGWVPLKELHSRVTEAEMLPIYDKIICRTLLELRAAKETP